MKPRFEIVPLRRRHLADVVDLHLRAFPGFFLSFLGPSFLREFYRSFLDDEAGLGFVSLDDRGRVIGVVVGPVSPAGYFKRLLWRRWWAFAFASARTFLARPRIAPRLVRALAYRGETPAGPSRALLSSIAVDPEARGGGAGAALVERFLAEVRRRGSKGCFLTTDAENNDLVNRFYLRLGWMRESTYRTPEGRRMNRYVIDFYPGRERPE